MSRHDDRRRIFLKAAAAAAWSALPLRSVLAQGAKIRIGLMLPYTGTYAQLGAAIENGFRLAFQERDGRLGGREVEFFKVDDESDPAKAPENASRLVSRDKVDVLVGTVHSGVALGMSKVAREAGLITVVPNAGADALTGPLCAPNIFRASFSNWQTIYPLGKVVASRGLKRAVFITWKYAAGEEMIAAFRQGYEEAGGKLIKELTLPFPNVEFQALLTEIASVKPDAVACFFSGGGAVKFMKDYAAAGLKGKVPLYGPGFLTDGVLEAVGDAAEGVETTLHYADSLDTKRDDAFRLAYARTYKLQPDAFAVQGYDAALLLAAGADAVKGDVAQRAAMIRAMETAKIDSPRGAFTMSRAHNPVMDIYLRKVVGAENRVIGVAHKALADPARGCRLV
jgi:branched-chain amino acid transport system substrate-binding protein